MSRQPFGNRVAVLERRDYGPTGRFEVVVRETKQVIFSRQQGMGLPDTPEKIQAVAQIVESILREEQHKKGKKRNTEKKEGDVNAVERT